MLGRIRALPSSLDNLEGAPSKILKDDSFSIYEATLMKLKLGAQRDLSAASKESDEIITDFAVSSSCNEEINMEVDCNQARASSSQDIVSSPRDEMMTDTDCSSINTSPCCSDHSLANPEEQRHNNVSILHLFAKFKNSKHACNSSHGELVSTENDSSVSISSSSSESQYTSETESIQSSFSS